MEQLSKKAMACLLLQEVAVCLPFHQTIRTIVYSNIYFFQYSHTDSDGTNGFSCADPAWDAVKWGVTGYQEAFGFQSGYSSRCVDLGTGVATSTMTYPKRVGCLPMACVNGDLQAGYATQERIYSRFFLVQFSHGYSRGLNNCSKQRPMHSGASVCMPCSAHEHTALCQCHSACVNKHT